MNKCIVVSILLLFCMSAFSQMPQKAEVLEKARKTEQYFDLYYKKMPDSVKVNDYMAGIYNLGLHRFGALSKNTKMVQKSNSWAQNASFKIPGNEQAYKPQNMANGFVFIEMAQAKQNFGTVTDSIKIAAEALIESGEVYLWNNLEAMFQGMPVLAKLGVETNDAKYHEQMFQLFAYSKNVFGLYSDQEFLWYRDETFRQPNRTPSGQSIFWARGNGMLAVALTEVLSVLPKDAPHYNEYLDTYLEIMIALANMQRNDGFWNASLIDQDYYSGAELTGTALIVKGIAWGLRTQNIDPTTYTPVLQKGARALMKAVAIDGRLFYAQPNNSIEPKDGHPFTKLIKLTNLHLSHGLYLLACAELLQYQDFKNKKRK